MIALAVAIRWRREHPLLEASLVALPPLAAAYALVGIYGEIRVFYEFVPAGIVWVVNAALQAVQVAPYASDDPDGVLSPGSRPAAAGSSASEIESSAHGGF